MSPDQADTGTWRHLLRAKNGLLALALTGGVALHAINVHIVTTVLPSVVQDIGGLDWYAWNTTLFVVASIVGAALSVRLLAALGPRGASIAALVVFALGSAGCALAPSMPWMLASRGVQGLGGGTLAALSYALIRVVFAPPLWPRAVAMVSGMWGVATLCGPAVGGLFAQVGHWRWAFWALLPVSLMQGVLVAGQLRPDGKPAASAASAAAPSIPAVQIALLAASVLAVAAGSLSDEMAWQAAGMVAGLALGAVAIAWDRRAPVRLLPTGGTKSGTPLGAVYASVALLLVGTTTEVFVPYFLQTLHGHTPLAAGYLTAAMAGGWSLGALLSSGQDGARAARLLRVGPVLCAASLLALALVVPAGASLAPAVRTLLSGLALAGAGAGVGIGWPHLLTHVLTLAPRGEEGMASAAITTVQLYGMAIGAAVAGLVANAAGLSTPGGTEGAQSAARWLFASFALAPALASLAARRITHRVAGASR
ncbi:MFS transporter [Cupriavidus basilensis]|uniref:MFS transporter n=1 Tax=Cupriavidus basilensis TaxID=68895 RepID=UPI00157A811B|nr:MFS transporter [Cupriavidus basilensis]NUA32008.1 MFS transporter [Cupriavidus basilensis]